MTRPAPATTYRRIRRGGAILSAGIAAFASGCAALIAAVAHGPQLVVGVVAFLAGIGGLVWAMRPRRLEGAACDSPCANCSAAGSCQSRLTGVLEERIARFDAERFGEIADRLVGLVALPLGLAIVAVMVGAWVAVVGAAVSALLLVAGLVTAKRLAPR